MRATLGIEACIGQPKALDRASVDQVLADDLLNVLRVNEAVPDGIGIDHDDGSMLALVEASELIGADLALQAGVFHGILEG